MLGYRLSGHVHLKGELGRGDRPRTTGYPADCLRSRVLGKLGLMSVAGLLHRNQTLCPTRTTPSGLCTGGPSPGGPDPV